MSRIEGAPKGWSRYEQEEFAAGTVERAEARQGFPSATNVFNGAMWVLDLWARSAHAGMATLEDPELDKWTTGDALLHIPSLGVPGVGNDKNWELYKKHWNSDHSKELRFQDLKSLEWAYRMIYTAHRLGHRMYMTPGSGTAAKWAVQSLAGYHKFDMDEMALAQHRDMVELNRRAKSDKSAKGVLPPGAFKPDVYWRDKNLLQVIQETYHNDDDYHDWVNQYGRLWVDLPAAFFFDLGNPIFATMHAMYYGTKVFSAGTRAAARFGQGEIRGLRNFLDERVMKKWQGLNKTQLMRRMIGDLELGDLDDSIVEMTHDLVKSKQFSTLRHRLDELGLKTRTFMSDMRDDAPQWFRVAGSMVSPWTARKMENFAKKFSVRGRPVTPDAQRLNTEMMERATLHKRLWLGATARSEEFMQALRKLTEEEILDLGELLQSKKLMGEVWHDFHNGVRADLPTEAVMDAYRKYVDGVDWSFLNRFEDWPNKVYPRLEEALNKLKGFYKKKNKEFRGRFATPDEVKEHTARLKRARELGQQHENQLRISVGFEGQIDELKATLRRDRTNATKLSKKGEDVKKLREKISKDNATLKELQTKLKDSEAKSNEILKLQGEVTPTPGAEPLLARQAVKPGQLKATRAVRGDGSTIKYFESYEGKKGHEVLINLNTGELIDIPDKNVFESIMRPLRDGPAWLNWYVQKIASNFETMSDEAIDAFKTNILDRQKRFNEARKGFKRMTREELRAKGANSVLEAMHRGFRKALGDSITETTDTTLRNFRDRTKRMRLDTINAPAADFGGEHVKRRIIRSHDDTLKMINTALGHSPEVQYKFLRAYDVGLRIAKQNWLFLSPGWHAQNWGDNNLKNFLVTRSREFARYLERGSANLNPRWNEATEMISGTTGFGGVAGEKTQMFGAPGSSVAIPEKFGDIPKELVEAIREPLSDFGGAVNKKIGNFVDDTADFVTKKLEALGTKMKIGDWRIPVVAGKKVANLADIPGFAGVAKRSEQAADLIEGNTRNWLAGVIYQGTHDILDDAADALRRAGKAFPSPKARHFASVNKTQKILSQTQFFADALPDAMLMVERVVPFSMTFAMPNMIFWLKQMAERPALSAAVLRSREMAKDASRDSRGWIKIPGFETAADPFRVMGFGKVLRQLDRTVAPFKPGTWEFDQARLMKTLSSATATFAGDWYFLKDLRSALVGGKNALIEGTENMSRRERQEFFDAGENFLPGLGFMQNVAMSVTGKSIGENFKEQFWPEGADKNRAFDRGVHKQKMLQWLADGGDPHGPGLTDLNRPVPTPIDDNEAAHRHVYERAIRIGLPMIFGIPMRHDPGGRMSWLQKKVDDAVLSWRRVDYNRIRKQLGFDWTGKPILDQLVPNPRTNEAWREMRETLENPKIPVEKKLEKMSDWSEHNRTKWFPFSEEFSGTIQDILVEANNQVGKAITWTLDTAKEMGRNMREQFNNPNSGIVGTAEASGFTKKYRIEMAAPDGSVSDENREQIQQQAAYYQAATKTQKIQVPFIDENGKIQKEQLQINNDLAERVREMEINNVAKKTSHDLPPFDKPFRGYDPNQFAVPEPPLSEKDEKFILSAAGYKKYGYFLPVPMKRDGATGWDFVHPLAKGPQYPGDPNSDWRTAYADVVEERMNRAFVSYFNGYQQIRTPEQYKAWKQGVVQFQDGTKIHFGVFSNATPVLPNGKRYPTVHAMTNQRAFDRPQPIFGNTVWDHTKINFTFRQVFDSILEDKPPVAVQEREKAFKKQRVERMKKYTEMLRNSSRMPTEYPPNQTLHALRQESLLGEEGTKQFFEDLDMNGEGSLITDFGLARTYHSARFDRSFLFVGPRRDVDPETFDGMWHGGDPEDRRKLRVMAVYHPKLRQHFEEEGIEFDYQQVKAEEGLEVRLQTHGRFDMEVINQNPYLFHALDEDAQEEIKSDIMDKVMAGAPLVQGLEAIAKEIKMVRKTPTDVATEEAKKKRGPDATPTEEEIRKAEIEEIVEDELDAEANAEMNRPFIKDMDARLRKNPPAYTRAPIRQYGTPTEYYSGVLRAQKQDRERWRQAVGAEANKEIDRNPRLKIEADNNPKFREQFIKQSQLETRGPNFFGTAARHLLGLSPTAWVGAAGGVVNIGANLGVLSFRDARNINQMLFQQQVQQTGQSLARGVLFIVGSTTRARTHGEALEEFTRDNKKAAITNAVTNYTGQAFTLASGLAAQKGDTRGTAETLGGVGGALQGFSFARPFGRRAGFAGAVVFGALGAFSAGRRSRRVRAAREDAERRRREFEEENRKREAERARIQRIREADFASRSLAASRRSLSLRIARGPRNANDANQLSRFFRRPSFRDSQGLVGQVERQASRQFRPRF